MKISRNDAHDRLLHLKKDQSENLAQGCQDCLKKNSDSLALQSRCHYIYIFAHPRTAEDGANKRMLWQPRLCKPKAQTNSYLFRAQSNTDLIECCWMIPAREQWDQYKKGNVTESDIVRWSIDQFMNNREQLEFPFEDDLSDERAKAIWIDIARVKEQDLRMNKMYSTPKTEEPYLSSYWKS